jgi:hypothetical protein
MKPRIASLDEVPKRMRQLYKPAGVAFEIDLARVGEALESAHNFKLEMSLLPLATAAGVNQKRFGTFFKTIRESLDLNEKGVPVIVDQDGFQTHLKPEDFISGMKTEHAWAFESDDEPKKKPGAKGGQRKADFDRGEKLKFIEDNGYSAWEELPD